MEERNDWMIIPDIGRTTELTEVEVALNYLISQYSRLVIADLRDFREYDHRINRYGLACILYQRALFDNSSEGLKNE